MGGVLARGDYFDCVLSINIVLLYCDILSRKEMRQMVYSIEDIKRIVTPIAKKHGIKRIYLFGSYAKGTADDASDIDLLIDTAGTAIKSLLSLSAVYCELEEAFAKPIDLITVSSLEQAPAIPSEEAFRANVINERVSVYAVA